MKPLRLAPGVPDFVVGDYDLTEFDMRYSRDFSPSLASRRAYMYLQSLGDFTFGPSYYTRRDNLPSYLLIHTTSGAGTLDYMGKRYELHLNDGFLIDCRRLHDYRAISQDGWGYRMAHFDGGPMPEFYQQILASGSVAFRFESDSPFDKLFTELFEANRTPAPDAELISHSLLTQLMMELLRRLPQYIASEPPGHIRAISDYLTHHCAEKQTLDQLAERFHLSKYHLSRAFKRHTGRTVFEYITSQRIELARRLLRYTDLPVAQITESIGFEDHSNFTRVFRQVEGLTPTAYRRQWRGQ